MSRVLRNMKMIKRFFARTARIIYRAAFMLIYLLFRHRKIVMKLKSYGILDIKIFKPRIWYIGLKKSRITEKRIMRYYYRAIYNGKSCFIKIGKNDTSAREILINEYINKHGSDFVPTMLLCDRNYAKNTALLVTEYIPDVRNLNIPDDKAALETICEEFVNIHKQLYELDIIHGDLSVRNLSVTEDNHVIVFDFGIVFSPVFGAFQLNTPCIGTHYKVSGDKCIYDNAYSFLCVLDECGIADSYKQEECYKRLERLVGVHTHIMRYS